MSEIDLFAQIVFDHFNVPEDKRDNVMEFIRDKGYIIVIVSTVEKSKVPSWLVRLGAVIIPYGLVNGDYLVSSLCGIELKRKDYTSSIFGTAEHNLWDQMYLLSKSVRKPNLILRDYKSEFGRYSESRQKSLRGALFSLRRMYPVWTEFEYQNEKEEYKKKNIITDKDVAELIIKIAKAEQKKKGKGVSRAAPKNATWPEKRRFFVEGFPHVGADLSPKIIESFPTLYDFIINVCRSKILYTKTMNPKGVSGIKIKNVGWKTIMDWQKLLLENGE